MFRLTLKHKLGMQAVIAVGLTVFIILLPLARWAPTTLADDYPIVKVKKVNDTHWRVVWKNLLEEKVESEEGYGLQLWDSRKDLGNARWFAGEVVTARTVWGEALVHRPLQFSVLCVADGDHTGETRSQYHYLPCFMWKWREPRVAASNCNRGACGFDDAIWVFLVMWPLAGIWMIVVYSLCEDLNYIRNTPSEEYKPWRATALAYVVWDMCTCCCFKTRSVPRWVAECKVEGEPVVGRHC